VRPCERRGRLASQNSSSRPALLCLLIAFALAHLVSPTSCSRYVPITRKARILELLTRAPFVCRRRCLRVWVLTTKFNPGRWRATALCAVPAGLRNGPLAVNNLGDQRTFRKALSRFLVGDDPCRLARASVAHGFWKPKLRRRHAGVAGPYPRRTGRQISECLLRAISSSCFVHRAVFQAMRGNISVSAFFQASVLRTNEVRLRISKIGACPLKALLTTTAR
jgi:hypothetical protein